METEKVIKRGYVKWTDADGVFHKEPLTDHPEMLAEATPAQQLQAEEARRLNAAAEQQMQATEDAVVDDTEQTLEALKAAPEDVLTAGQLVEEAPLAAAEDPGEKTPEVESLQLPAASPVVLEQPSEDSSDEHAAALAQLREQTAA